MELPEVAAGFDALCINAGASGFAATLLGGIGTDVGLSSAFGVRSPEAIWVSLVLEGAAMLVLASVDGAFCPLFAATGSSALSANAARPTVPGTGLDAISKLVSATDCAPGSGFGLFDAAACKGDPAIGRSGGSLMPGGNALALGGTSTGWPGAMGPATGTVRPVADGFSAVALAPTVFGSTATADGAAGLATTEIDGAVLGAGVANATVDAGGAGRSGTAFGVVELLGGRELTLDTLCCAADWLRRFGAEGLTALRLASRFVVSACSMDAKDGPCCCCGAGCGSGVGCVNELKSG